MYQDNMPI